MVMEVVEVIISSAVSGNGARGGAGTGTLYHYHSLLRVSSWVGSIVFYSLVLCCMVNDSYGMVKGYSCCFVFLCRICVVTESILSKKW